MIPLLIPNPRPMFSQETKEPVQCTIPVLLQINTE